MMYPVHKILTVSVGIIILIGLHLSEQVRVPSIFAQAWSGDRGAVLSFIQVLPLVLFVLAVVWQAAVKLTADYFTLFLVVTALTISYLSKPHSSPVEAMISASIVFLLAFRVIGWAGQGDQI